MQSLWSSEPHRDQIGWLFASPLDVDSTRQQCAYQRASKFGRVFHGRRKRRTSAAPGIFLSTSFGQNNTPRVGFLGALKGAALQLTIGAGLSPPLGVFWKHSKIYRCCMMYTTMR
ncbi:hypothetical protein JG688_00001299 [Phytophthora aleatoria]|uniref:Uncharacterized protein n=1 Tax=Phytophthora aleatoria TaxID=2496075 RepID=A0A8J5JGT8_9STRA|nr:hypothetical protein JG688_00001299 [Phytophthora aleatoria]